MISPMDSRVIDANSESLGVSISELMANAGQALAETVNDFFGDKRILFVCGSGNNGGDGLVAANILDSDVAMIKGPKSKEAIEAFGSLKKRPFEYREEVLKDYDVIVDCVLGTGIEGELREPYRRYIEAVNGSGKKIVSCDVPSGFGGDGPMVVPDLTVTFHDIKEGMNDENCGTIIIADIGIPDDAYGIVSKGDLLRYPIPGKNSHKGQNGRLLIIGGGPYTGAPSLAGMAALRIGTDLVHVAVPESSFLTVALSSISLIVHKLPGDHIAPDSVDRLLELSECVDVVLIGPGIGSERETRTAAVDFITRCRTQLVVDADGITAIAGKVPNKNILFTPHEKEYLTLAGPDAIPEKTAKELGCVLVLKGSTDIITDGERTRRNVSGTPGMTVGGTGDVLSGTIAGLIAKGMSPFDAGCLGTYICGKAGEMSFKDYSYGMLATDVVDNMARFLSKEL